MISHCQRQHCTQNIKLIIECPWKLFLNVGLNNAKCASCTKCILLTKKIFSLMTMGAVYHTC